jgi:hypothetical protein
MPKRSCNRDRQLHPTERIQVQVEAEIDIQVERRNFAVSKSLTQSLTVGSVAFEKGGRTPSYTPRRSRPSVSRIRCSLADPVVATRDAFAAKHADFANTAASSGARRSPVTGTEWKFEHVRSRFQNARESRLRERLPRNDGGCRARSATGWDSGRFELRPLSLLGDPRLNVRCSSEWADRGRVVLRADDLYGEFIVDDRDDPIGRLRVGVARLGHVAHPF